MRCTSCSARRGLAGVALAAAFTGLLLAACDDDHDRLGPSDIVVATISIDPPTAPPRVVPPGVSVQLAAIARNADGDVVDVTFAWASSDPAVAAVSRSGLVTAKAEGVVTITATAQKKSGSTTLIVQIPGAAVVLAPDAAVLDRGTTLQLAATVKDAAGNVLDRPVAFTSQNTVVATVTPTGLVTALAVGEASIVATAGDVFGAMRVTVQEPVASITLDPPSATIAVDQTVQLTATPKDAAGRALNRPVGWSSSNPAVATVDEAGLVTGRAVGSATVTASAGGRHAGVVVVVQVPAASVTITSPTHGSEPLEIGATLQLTATVKDDQGNVLDRPVVWSSSDPGVAAVDQSGLVTGVARGNATITATCEGVSATLAVRVVGESEELTGNNLSVPVVFAEGIGVTGQPLGVETGLRPTAAEGITVDALPFFYAGNTPDCGAGFYCQGGSNVWQAEWLDGSAAGMQSAEVSWGDNLTHHQWTTHSMIRVEVRLAAWSAAPLAGFNMPYAVGEGETEMQGTDGTTAPMIPNLYAVTPRLVIQKLDDVTREPVATVFDGAIWEAFGTDGPGGFSAEVNVGGAVIYGYNLQIRNLTLPPDLHKYGWWRLTFRLDDAAQVGGTPVARNLSLDRLAAAEGDEGEELLFQPQLDPAAQTSWLDIEVKSSSGGGGH